MRTEDNFSPSTLSALNPFFLEGSQTDINFSSLSSSSIAEVEMIRAARGVELKNAVKVTEKRMRRQMTERMDQLRTKYEEDFGRLQDHYADAKDTIMRRE
jgi:hypothetical protein